jgi:multicomponent Na+:H+ antiporter subunit D
VAPVVALAAMTLAIGLYPDPLLSFAEDAAAQIMDPSSYLAALGVTP